MITVGKYTFSSWLRRGIGGAINETDTLGAGGGAVKERATVRVQVRVNAQSVPKDFTLLGPGDAVGINRDMVVRTEPADWVTDFEPNYLAFIEFYDEDLLWRYTPARAAGNRLRPWLSLVVLEEPTAESPGEFSRDDKRLPLPVITVRSAASLPPATQTWAWAHVHTNESFDNATDFERFLESLNEPDHPNHDRITCRLVSPRRLKPNTAYGAFVVPVFETGRLAGLKQDPKDVDAQQPAWSNAPGPVELPVFYAWRFRTGENEDFESMIKRLEPRAADPRVGVRPMDGEKPGWGLTVGTDIGQVVPADEKQTVLGLEGALRAPATRSRPSSVEPTRPFFVQLAARLNEPEQRRRQPATAHLPVVAPPIYGEHHALRSTVDPAQTGWLDELNRDPRHRVAAGFGVRVVREHQENYVARAWAQVRAVLEANRLIRLAAYAMRASDATYRNLAAKFAPEQTVGFFAPLLRKVRGSPTSLQHLLDRSLLPPAAVSGALRRLLRPRGALARRAGGARGLQAELIRGLADGTLRAAPPKAPAPDLATDEKLVDRLPPAAGPGLWSWLLRFWLALLLLLLALLLLLVLGAPALVPALVLAGLALGAYRIAGRAPLPPAGPGPAALPDAGSVTAAVRAAPPRPDFRFVETDPVVPPAGGPYAPATTTQIRTSAAPDAVAFTQIEYRTPGAAGADTREAAAFRRAALALAQRVDLTMSDAIAEPVRPRFDLVNAQVKLQTAVDPLRAFPRRVAANVRFVFDPAWLQQAEHLVPAMAYPDFDDPMYEKLRDLSSELLLPNLQLIPPNTVTLLKTNPAFIEAYLTGLNYEFGKELLWREYPTDRRGSYFRQFWDVRGILAQGSGEGAAAVAERGRDIVPLDTWPPSSRLGTHRNPQRPAGEQVVLAVRGDLLKKYPNTLIYAQKAHVARDGAGNPRPGEPPVVKTVASQAEIAAEIKFPAFRAAVEPDVRFYGFDLTVEQARGAAQPRGATDDWGWYFVIQQLPGEPRFGMDSAFAPDNDPATPITWNDLAWDKYPPAQAFIDTTVPPQSFTPAGSGESLAQWGGDSAQMASILYQTPVMVAVHAREMLEGLS